MKRRDFTEGSIVSHMIYLSIPIVLGLLSLMLFQIIDAYFVAHLGTAELAAMSFIFPVSYVILNVGVGLGVGATSIISKAAGTHDLEKTALASTGAMLMALILGCGFSFLGLMTIQPLFELMGADSVVLVHVRNYIWIWYLGLPLLLFSMIGTRACRSWGEARLSGMAMIMGSLLNAALDPLFIFGYWGFPEMGIAGAAWATLVSWLASALFTLYLVGPRLKLFRVFSIAWYDLRNCWKRMLKIAVPAMVTNLMHPLATAVITTIMAIYGHAASAALGVGLRIEQMAMAIVFAMTASLPIIVAQNWGAGKWERSQEAIRKSFGFSLKLQLGIAVTMFLAAPWIAWAFSEDPLVIEHLVTLLRTLPVAYGMLGILLLSCSSFNAIHRPLLGTGLNGVRVLGCYLPFCVLGSWLGGVNGVLIGACTANIVAGVLAYLFVSQRLLKKGTAPFSSSAS